MAPDHITALRVYPGLAWFRVRGYGPWLAWGGTTDLHIVRKTARRVGRFRWRVLRPAAA